jgi:hypothetical protein
MYHGVRWVLPRLMQRSLQGVSLFQTHIVEKQLPHVRCERRAKKPALGRLKKPAPEVIRVV